MMHNETELFHFKTVDRFNREKLYIQLTRIFVEEISSGRWKLNQKIPTEEELCGKYDVSKITVRQAINNLVSDGYLMKIQGKGTYVISSLPIVGLAMKTRFTEDMFGKEVKAEKEIISLGTEDIPPEVKAYLRTNDAVYHVLCKRKMNEKTAYLDESFIPRHIMPDLGNLDIAHISLYSLLQERGTKKIFKVIQTVEVSKVWGDSAKYLELKEGTHVLAVHRLLFSSDNTPVGYTRFLGGTDRYKFQTEFERIR
jgi:GntR family transcriptional regulator